MWPTGNQRTIKALGLGWEEESGDVLFAADGTQIVEEGRLVRARSEDEEEVTGAEGEYDSPEKP